MLTIEYGSDLSQGDVCPRLYMDNHRAATPTREDRYFKRKMSCLVSPFLHALNSLALAHIAVVSAYLSQCGGENKYVHFNRIVAIIPHTATGHVPLAILHS